MEYYSAIKKNKILPLTTTWMDLQVKSERERQIPYDITYMWNLNYDTNEQNNVIDLENKFVVARGGGWWYA